MPSSILRPAQTLDELYVTLRPEPLMNPDSLNAFYGEQLNTIRGYDRILDIVECLLFKTYDSNFKGALFGHSGCGKSTEITRLINKPEIQEQFMPVRISVENLLDPNHFQPLDIILLLIFGVVEKAETLGMKTKSETLQKVHRWFDQDLVKWDEEIKKSAEATGETSFQANPWQWFANLSLKVKGEVKYASNRKLEVIQYRLSRIDELVSICNDVIADLSEELKIQEGKRWLFLIEGLEKPQFSRSGVKQFFVSYGSVIRSLNTSLLFTLPIWLQYSSDDSLFLPFASEDRFILPDVYVYKRDHSPNPEGRTALRSIIERRMDLSLFESPSALERVIVASGGHLRDLFRLINDAVLAANRRQSQLPRTDRRLNDHDVEMAIINLRVDNKNLLGVSDSDKSDGEQITTDAKLTRLEAIYQEGLQVFPDDTLYSLLRSRAVQEFNQQRWFGVTPIVVDILESNKRLSNYRQADGTVPGGTNHLG